MSGESTAIRPSVPRSEFTYGCGQCAMTLHQVVMKKLRYYRWASYQGVTSFYTSTPNLPWQRSFLHLGSGEIVEVHSTAPPYRRVDTGEQVSARIDAMPCSCGGAARDGH